ncbi:hypothetical protein RUM43_014712 [Polyplax serrata]|uniref:Uncharacterized protein n=1 Tax=Polyplax serrata TaxID=468196 RepID=A0AAN8RS00_POLSC
MSACQILQGVLTCRVCLRPAGRESQPIPLLASKSKSNLGKSFLVVPRGIRLGREPPPDSHHE